MIDRCGNPNHVGAKYYINVKVCNRWRNSFSNFLAAMGPKPSRHHTIDRYPDADGDYEPGNCRWATPEQQRANQRPYDERDRVLKAWETRSRTARNRSDITGQAFGRLTVIRYVGTNRDRKAQWLCRCECGEDATVTGKSLRSGITTSCGCYTRELARERAIIRNRTNNPALARWRK